MLVRIVFDNGMLNKLRLIYPSLDPLPANGYYLFERNLEFANELKFKCGFGSVDTPWLVYARCNKVSESINKSASVSEIMAA